MIAALRAFNPSSQSHTSSQREATHRLGAAVGGVKAGASGGAALGLLLQCGLSAVVEGGLVHIGVGPLTDTASCHCGSRAAVRAQA